MRKLFVTVTLLVMLAVSCENGSVAEKAEYTEDGERLVTLKVNIDGAAGSRSLSNASAKEDADFVEVIFKKGTTFYRATGYYGESLSIKLPKASYPVTDAVILIGKKNTSDYTLLAIAALDDTLDLTSSSSTAINFTVVSSLTAALSAAADSPAFVITDTGFWGSTSAGISKNGKYGAVPSFQVPKQAGINASLTIGGFPTGPVLKSAASPTPAAKIAKIADPATSVITPTYDATPVTFSGGNCTFGFSFSTATADETQYIITFSIPVVFDTDTKGLGWVIRGGTQKDVYDASGTKAEGVLLTVSAAANEELVEHPIGTPVIPTLP